jgi:hypothetical protein
MEYHPAHQAGHYARTSHASHFPLNGTDWAHDREDFSYREDFSRV